MSSAPRFEQEVGVAFQKAAAQSELLSILDPVGQFVEGQAEFKKSMVKAGQEALESLAVVPETRPGSDAEAFITDDVASGLGSTLPFLAIGGGAAAVGGSPTVATSLSGAALGGAIEHEKAEQAGSSDEERWASFAAGAGVGASEGVIGKMLARWDQASGGGVWEFLVNRVLDAGTEGIQEGFQELMSNVVARHIRDEDVELSENVIRAGSAGALTGLLLGVAAEGAQRSAMRQQEDQAPSGAEGEADSVVGQAPEAPEGATLPEEVQVDPRRSTESLTPSTPTPTEPQRRAGELEGDQVDLDDPRSIALARARIEDEIGALEAGQRPPREGESVAEAVEGLQAALQALV